MQHQLALNNDNKNDQLYIADYLADTQKHYIPLLILPNLKDREGR